jgi:hypothetical protein
MFKLIKWAFYGLMGYALYELYLGVMQQGGQGQQGQNRGQSGGQSGMGQDFSRDKQGRFTGQGRGMTERSEESSSGMSAPHAVGRGVVH